MGFRGMYLLEAHQPASGAKFSERASPTAEMHVPTLQLFEVCYGLLRTCLISRTPSSEFSQIIHSVIQYLFRYNSISLIWAEYPKYRAQRFPPR